MDGRFRDNINSRIGWAEWRILTGITDLSAESARRLTLIFSARKSRCPRVYRHLGTYSLEERIIAPRVSEIRPFRWPSEAALIPRLPTPPVLLCPPPRLRDRKTPP